MTSEVQDISEAYIHLIHTKIILQITILSVTLCNEFIPILQPNLISNVFHIRTMHLS